MVCGPRLGDHRAPCHCTKMPPMLRLFHFPASCSVASHFVLEEAGADYELVRVDLANGEQTKPEFLAVNPKGRVPALQTEHGILTETPAIIVYIAQVHPAANLVPFDDAIQFARMQSFNAYLSSTVHVAHAHKMRGTRWADDPAAIAEMTRKVPQTMAACFELIERDYLTGPWVLGERYSVADPYLYTMSTWLAADGVDVARFPRVQDFMRRMAARPAIRRVLDAR